MSESGEIDVQVENGPAVATRREVISGLAAFNDGRAGAAGHTEVAVIARHDGEVVGGLFGFTNWEWLSIGQLWVSSSLRRCGIGARLLSAAEAEARARGCRHAHVDTFSFQALPFYEQLGYTVFGRLEDYPQGHTRYFLQKRDLAMPGAE